MKLTAVLYLPTLTRTVYFRPYLSSLNSRPILARLADAVLLHSGADRLVILHHYTSEEEPLHAALEWE